MIVVYLIQYSTSSEELKNVGAGGQRESSLFVFVGVSSRMAADTGRVQRTRALTNEKRTTLLLNKIKKFQGLFECLEAVCSTAEDVRCMISAIVLLLNVFADQPTCQGSSYCDSSSILGKYPSVYLRSYA